ncbi:MAG: carbamoyltransferase HypF [Armatimonadetes bacterium]|nr:carbamoyltransferase HypF [Armatimonadota bacterium]
MNPNRTAHRGNNRRLRVIANGAVQGVGFRPFIYRLAEERGLLGWVKNSPQGVIVEVEGPLDDLEGFLLDMEQRKPPLSFIQSLEPSYFEPAGYNKLEILPCDETGNKTTLILPDIATCPDCLKEIFDSSDRRNRYPFANCTHCGPRFSIIESLPYDRPNTTMKIFEMCPLCREEYEDPGNRRFHAQPTACPTCGPWLELWDEKGRGLASRDEAIAGAAEAVRAGLILALKGLGGFHLMVDARNEKAVNRLRKRKKRGEKPFALMYPSFGMIQEHCTVSEMEGGLLCSTESPIVLLRRKESTSLGSIALSVAPGNPCLGVMLPYTPLHHLLVAELGFPIVATSGNLSDEPMCTDENEALERLGGIADLFLVHNRPIVRHMDDSIVRVLAGEPSILRRARGYAPLPISLSDPMPPVLAVGGHLKNCAALSVGKQVFVGQHIGDLETEQAYGALLRESRDLPHLYDTKPSAIACDEHPEYLSTKFAGEQGIRTIAIQHHFAHVVSCMAENGLAGAVLGVSWDGTGYGPDRTIWGGEILLATRESFQRIGHLRTFRLPGGAMAVQEPRRTAIGLLYEVFGARLPEDRSLPPVRSFSGPDLVLIREMLKKKLFSPLTSSAGRLFDAIASLLGLCHQNHFEGEAAMALEYAIGDEGTDAIYPLRTVESPESLLVGDWAPMVRAILEDMGEHVPVGQISAKFHNTLVEWIILCARKTGQERVVLTGGCFQNKYLLERAVFRLRKEGFHPCVHRRIPPNDGGIALGQIVAAAHQLRKESVSCV